MPSGSRTSPTSPPWRGYVALVIDAYARGVEPSVGSVGHRYDNALADTTKGLYKSGLSIFEAVEFATLE
jgi:hypothetical protein